MNNFIKPVFTLGLAAAALVVSTVPAHAEVHSKSKELVVMGPRDLPEPAQIRGNSLFLHVDGAGRTYLYVEQQQGSRLSVFDVTDPAHIKLAVTTPLLGEGAFDFIRPLGDSAELICFRDGQKAGVLDLRHAKKPVLRTASAAGLGTVETLGQAGLLAADESYQYVPVAARDYRVIDISAGNPSILATVKAVKHRAVNDETGTTFFLGSDGLTVVRQIDVENEHKVRELQMYGN